MSQEEVLLTCAAYITMYLAENKSKHKKRVWIRKFLEERNRCCILSNLQMSDGSFCNFTRMTTTDFEVLLQMAGSSIAKTNTKFRDSVKPETRSAITCSIHLPFYSDFYNRLFARSIRHSFPWYNSINFKTRSFVHCTFMVPRHVHSARNLMQQSRDPLMFSHVAASQPITGHMMFVAEHAATCRGTSSNFVPIQYAATFVP
jgi:hypothetical protein